MQWADPNNPAAPADPNVYLELTVQVNDGAEPAGKLVNIAKAESDTSFAEYREETPVRCWGGDKIFVDVFATGYKTGADWENAYTDLQDALERIDEEGCGNEIWVARGIYSPGNDPTNTFKIPDEVVLYGGLASNEDPVSFDPNDREIIKYQSVLAGNNVNDKVVTMGQNTKLHGFVIEEADIWGVFGTGDDFTVERCAIKDNEDTGIECTYGNLTVNWCVIRDNTDDGIYHSGYNKKLKVNNCKIYENGENGIYSYYSTPTIKNSMIFYNGEDGTVYYGVKLQNPWDTPVIRNCTIADNINEGIYYTGSNTPDISNSIIWHNNSDNGYFQLSEHCPVPTYSCITDPNDPEGEDPGADEPDEETGNISANPHFAYTDPNLANYHLDPCSPCIDTGDPCDTCDGELDIDGNDRVLNGDDYSPDNGRVDIGADEVSCDDIYNSLDFNGDGLVNNNEFALFSKAWLQYDPDEYTGTDPNDTVNWDPICNLDDTGDSQYVIDLADVVIFAESWCWQACWKDLEKGFMMMGMGGGGESILIAQAELLSPTTTQEEASSKPSEPSIEEQIEQIKYLLEWLYEVKDEIDEDIWLNLTSSLEDMLKELEAD